MLFYYFFNFDFIFRLTSPMALLTGVVSNRRDNIYITALCARPWKSEWG